MTLGKWALAALAFAMTVAGATAESSQAVKIYHCGNSYHRAVSVLGNPAGTARCHAHVATDARGNPLNGKLNPNAAGAPSGYGPGDLRSAYNITSAGSATTIA